jgi:hypothetical protein
MKPEPLMWEEIRGLEEQAVEIQLVSVGREVLTDWMRATRSIR